MGLFSNGNESDITATAEAAEAAEAETAPTANIRFEVVELVDDRVRVSGTDKFGTTDETVLYVAQYNQVRADLKHMDAHDEFDARVQEFFRPLTEAKALLAQDHRPKIDMSSVIVIDEGQASVEGRDAVVVELDHDSHVYRLIESGREDRLVWVSGRLEILAA